MTAIPDTRPKMRGARFLQSRGMRRFFRHKLAVLGLAMITLIAVACIVGPWLLPHDMLDIDIRGRFSPPLTDTYLFGTDEMGRDLAARLFMAGRVSLMVGVAAMVLSTVVGTVIGLLAGHFGGALSTALMRFTDAFLCFPQIFLLLALAAFLEPDAMMITIIIALTSWMEIARIVAAEIRSLRERDFVTAARVSGASHAWIMFRELLPNAAGPIIVAATLTVARAILIEAYVSFLGYGIQPPLPSWGNMLNNAQQYLDSAPWLAIVPGVAITLAVTSFNFIGDGLRDALDARSDMP
ncbi:peptide/nickel transport system permease protein [Palleronia aestuarii]|uniref:Peptide/nickel transport system permease protein n=1 Tax=Palleronia aestuarii TaxID=568105 RepID=A0A2W7NEB3_9RHOB|nr:ABC transporter permease [Palleronia aestuarii]PZX18765.1 peptide/nickel transport system permease protein [Palleronia aestuarii]